MAGHLYAVIFEQGTVKVGMSLKDPSYRMRAHYYDGAKWSIKVVAELSIKFEGDDVAFRELSLCGYCQREAESVSGREWFKFENCEIAKSKIKEFFEKIKNNEFGKVQVRSYWPNDDKKARFDAAMVMIKEGMNPRDAANTVGIHHISVMRKREYLEWRDNDLKQKQAEIRKAQEETNG